MRSCRCRAAARAGRARLGCGPAAQGATACALVALPALLTASCSSGPAPPEGPEPVGRVVQTWRQGQTADLAELQALAPPGSVVLVADPTQRDRLRAASPLDQTPLARVDLGVSVLVIAGYPNCQAASHLEFDSQHRTLTFVVTRDEKVNCVWAPYTVDAHEVARSDLGGYEPDDVTLTRAGAG